MIIEFFNLQQTGLGSKEALAYLAHKYFPQKIMLWAQDPEQAKAIDDWLWVYEAQAFLPHALAGATDNAGEPVLISLEPKNLNRAGVLLLAFNPPISWLPDNEFARVVELIPTTPGPGLEASRQRYRLLSKKAKLEHTTSLNHKQG